MVKKQIRTCALYCRVSTGSQSYDMQAADLRRYAEARGWEVVQVVEEKISGAKRRPQRQALMRDAIAGKFDAVLAWSLSRWGRSNVDLLQSVNALDEAHVTFVSYTENFDLSTSTGRLMMGMLASFAQFQREQIVESVNAGIAHAKRHGTKSGRGFGRPATVEARRIEIRALHNAGISMAAIARKLSIGYGSVHRTINEPKTAAKHR